jgi:hypothetical protein
MIVNFTKIQSTPPASTSSHPEIQEYHHTIVKEVDGCEPVTSSFLELTIRNEGFKATPYSLDDMIHF